jgi:hypothetical protein
MSTLTPAELAGLRWSLADCPAAVYTPDDGHAYQCPNTAAPPHTGCGRTLDVPTAESLADHFARHGIEAHVIVYGIPWTAREARKPAQGA